MSLLNTLRKPHAHLMMNWNYIVQEKVVSVGNMYKAFLFLFTILLGVIRISRL